MGKTGSINWVKVKGRKGRVIKVQKSQAQKAHPGPAQRFTSSGHKRRFIRRSAKALVKWLKDFFYFCFFDFISKKFEDLLCGKFKESRVSHTLLRDEINFLPDKFDYYWSQSSTTGLQ